MDGDANIANITSVKRHLAATGIANIVCHFTFAPD
jgi:hypothetical protein